MPPKTNPASSNSGEDNIVDDEHEWKMYSEFRKILPEFDPVDDALTINEWISKVEKYGKVYGVDQNGMRHHALLKLVGVAKEWLDSIKEVDHTWKDWKQILIENFPVSNVKIVRRQKAENFKKARGMDMSVYYYKKLALCNQADMDDSETIERIVEGISDHRYRNFLGPLRNYKSPSTLLLDLKEASYVFDNNLNSNSGPSSNSGHQVNSRSSNYSNRTFNSANESNRRNESNFRSTNNYHQPSSATHQNNRNYSHQSTNPQGSRSSVPNTTKIKCFNCSKEGHFMRQCPDKIKPDVMHVHGDTHRKYFKSAVVLGNQIECYIDLGSSCTILRRDVADKCNINYYEDTNLNKLTGYGGGYVQPIGITTLSICVDGVNARTQVYIVDKEHQAVPLLIGHSFTEQPHVSINVNANGLFIQSAESQQFEVIEGEKQYKTDLKVTTPCIVPNEYVGNIRVTTDFKSEVLHIESKIRRDGTIIPNCIVNTNEDNTTVVPVVNFTGRELRWEKGAVLTRAEVCEENLHVNNNIGNFRESIKLEEIVTDENDKTEIHVLLNEYQDLVARKMEQVGLTDQIKMKIELKNPDKVIFYRPYRMSFSERKMVAEMVSELKNAGIVEDGQSEYASPVILVKKKTGDYRMCIDYRDLNRETVKDHYPIPRIDDQLDRLGNKRYFTSLDLFSGYYQVEMSEESRHKTAFVTPDGQYQFLRMPFGLCNAPSVFQRLINKILGNLRFSVAMAYLDDLLIATETKEEGLANLRTILNIIRTSGLTLNLKKCRFLMRKITYLGFEISEKGVQPGQGKINSLVNFPTPVDVRGVRGFLGLASYFRRFVGHFALIARPLTDLLSKSKVFEWTEEHQRSFESLKKSLASSPVLRVYDPKSLTELHTDASSLGLGAVLLQLQSDAKMHPIAFYSRKTTPEESKYHSIELEALAIVNAIDKFRVYLLGIPFIIRTDCNSLKLMEGKRDLNPRIARWLVKLMEFDYKVEYQTGAINRVADALSRNPINDGECMVMGINISTDWIACLQRNSPEIEAIRTRIMNKDKDMSKFVIYKSRVYKLSKSRWRLYVPSELKLELIIDAHKQVSHMGLDKTLEKLKESYYFPGMRAEVAKYVKRCINCLFYKVPVGKQAGLLHPIDKGSVPFDTVHADHLGPFNVTKDKRKYVFSIVDGFSKYVWLKPVRTVESRETANVFIEFMFCYGKPRRLITDRGSSFVGKIFNKLCESYNIMFVKVASQTPRANGQVETINRQILLGLKTMTADINCDDWDKVLLQVQWSINNSVHTVTKQTPSNIIYRYIPAGPHDNPLTEEINRINEEVGNTLVVKLQEISDLIYRDQEKQKKYYDSKRREGEKFIVGDLVMVRCLPVSTGASLKLEPSYRGPYQIYKVLDRDRFIVRDIDGELQSNRPFSGCIAIDKMKKITSGCDVVGPDR